MKYKLIIFDMDGTIVDTEPFYLEKLYETCSELGLNISKKELTKYSGKGLEEKIRDLQIISKKKVDSDKFVKEYRRLRSTPIDYLSIAFPGVIELIIELEKKGYILAVATNGQKKQIIEVLNQLGVLNCFSYLSSGRDIGFKKPNPKVYLNVLEHFNYKKSECIAIEDSTYGIMSAKNAGLYVLAKTDDRFNYLSSMADETFSTYNELKLRLLGGSDDAR